MLKSIIELLKTYYLVFLEGLWGTLWISAVVVVVATFVGALLGLSYFTRHKFLNKIIKIFVDIVRGTPILLQLYFFVYAVKPLFTNNPNNTLWVVLALIMNSSAYISEIFRAGINAVDKGQFEAAQSLGLSQKDMFRKVILPQALKNILPALGNEFIMMIKETSLASVFFINSLMTVEYQLSATTYKKTELLIITGVIYYALTTILSKIITHFEKKGKE